MEWTTEESRFRATHFSRLLNVHIDHWVHPASQPVVTGTLPRCKEAEGRSSPLTCILGFGASVAQGRLACHITWSAKVGGGKLLGETKAAQPEGWGLVDRLEAPLPMKLNVDYGRII